MKKFSKLAIFATLALIISLVSLPANTAFAAMADGTHDISYEIQEAGGGSVSIADGYFSKPAKLTVNGSSQSIQLTLTSADMIKSLSVQGTPVEVVSDSGDTRVVKFKVKDASKPVDMKMHVVVPDLYDTEHGARAIFDVGSVPAEASTPAKADDGKKTKDEKATSGSDDDGEETTKDSSSNDDGETAEESSDKGAAGKEDVDNPPTGDNTPIALYIGLLVGSIVLFTVYKFRFARN